MTQKRKQAGTATPARYQSSCPITDTASALMVQQSAWLVAAYQVRPELAVLVAAIAFGGEA